MIQLQAMNWLNIDGFNQQLFLDNIINFGFKLLGALAILVIGWFFISWTSRLIKAAFKRSHIEPTAATFLESFTNIALKGLLLITVVLQLGVKESSIITLLGTIGLAIGMALQGSLSNFAGGVLILVLKPFKVGDFIEVQNFSGKVDKIQVFNSRLLTPDNKAITIPNGTLANSIVINYSAKSQRRVDLAFNVSYDSDIEKVKQLLTRMINAHPKILKDPEPFLRLTAQAASSLTFTSRSWVNADDYWEVYFDLMEESKKILDQAGIEIPYNKLDINVFDKKSEK
ncbi:mechanosensitive ion channel family protein [Clostridiales bacterium COT073_COT-073]|nr:mechanosensitive ion channel family protein [Clostridiales bacterium COT073_COT-073]